MTVTLKSEFFEQRKIAVTPNWITNQYVAHRADTIDGKKAMARAKRLAVGVERWPDSTVDSLLNYLTPQSTRKIEVTSWVYRPPKEMTEGNRLVLGGERREPYLISLPVPVDLILDGEWWVFRAMHLSSERFVLTNAKNRDDATVLAMAMRCPPDWTQLHGLLWRDPDRPPKKKTSSQKKKRRRTSKKRRTP